MDVSLYEKMSSKTQNLVSEAERESQRQYVSTSILVINDKTPDSTRNISGFFRSTES